MKVLLRHPVHGEKHAYLPAEIEADKKNGWAEVKPEAKKEAKTEAKNEANKQVDNRDSLVAAYAKKHGRMPHPQMSVAKLKAALEG